MKSDSAKAEPLNLLLDWLNADYASRPVEYITRRVNAFLRTAIGDVRGGTLVIPAVRPLGGEEGARRLHADLRALLAGAVPTPTEVRSGFGAELFGFPSLRFAVRQQVPGRFQVVVEGDTRELVLFWAMRVLTDRGASVLGRCPAPALRRAGQPVDTVCGRWFFTAERGRVGRRRRFCSRTCQMRTFLRAETKKRRRPRRRRT